MSFKKCSSILACLIHNLLMITNKPLTTFVFVYMITCNPLIGNLLRTRLSPIFGGYKKNHSIMY